MRLVCAADMYSRFTCQSRTNISSLIGKYKMKLIVCHELKRGETRKLIIEWQSIEFFNGMIWVKKFNSGKYKNLEYLQGAEKGMSEK